MFIYIYYYIHVDCADYFHVFLSEEGGFYAAEDEGIMRYYFIMIYYPLAIYFFQKTTQSACGSLLNRNNFISRSQ